MRNLFWCKKCNAPTLAKICQVCNTQGKRVATDIRPIFPEEKILLETLLQYPIGYLSKKSTWYTSGNLLLIDRETIPLNKGDLEQLNVKNIRRELLNRMNVSNLDYEYSI